MNYTIKKTGFTLMETLIGVTFIGAASAGYISHNIQESQKEEMAEFLTDVQNVVEAVDHRISIDGYDASLWSNNNWSNKTEIINELIDKSLVSTGSTNCHNGIWTPSIPSEIKTKLIRCDLWKNKLHLDDFSISANLNNDSVGFINSFDINIYFKDEEAFGDRFKFIKKEFNKIKASTHDEKSGSFFIDLYSKNTNEIINSRECLNEKENCFIKASLERFNGGEYLLADGSNSLIGEHLTFIESRGQAPLKCLRWKNTLDDGSGAWTVTPDEDCGIGIYTELNHPAVVDVVVDNGTFEHILLDQSCNLYQYNSTSKIVEVSSSSPCGMINGSEAIQVIDNIHANTVVADDGKFNILNTDSLFASTIDTNTLTVSGLSSLKNVEIDGDLTIYGNISSSKQIVGSGTFKAPVGNFNNINTDINSIKNNLNFANNNLNKIKGTWITSGWSSCSKSCGNGYQTRSVTCPSNKLCLSSKPSTSKTCTGTSCGGGWSGGGHGSNSGAGGGEGG